MAMGASGGRSAGNKTAEGASRRATQRERDLIDPPRDISEPGVERTPTWVLTARGHRLLDWLAFGSWIVFCVIFAVVLCAWFGLVG